LKARFSPDEPNLRSMVSSVPKVSPPRVGVEASSFLVVVIAKKVCVRQRRTTGHGNTPYELLLSYRVLPHPTAP
jgi:hypothetical protein